MDSNTHNIVYKVEKDLEGGYAKAMYGPLSVIIDKYDMINLNKLALEAGMEYRFWKKSKFAKATIKAQLEEFEENGGDINHWLREETTSRDNDCRGTYGSRQLATVMTAMINAKFGVKVTKIVDRYFADQRIAELENQVEIQATEIQQLEATNQEITVAKSRAETLLEEMREENRLAREEAREAVRRLEEQNNQTHTELRLSRNETTQVRHVLEEVQETLEETQATVERTEARVRVMAAVTVPPAEDPGLLQHFCIMKLNMRLDDPRERWEYKVFCRQACSANIAKNEIRNKYGKKRVEVLLELMPNPNAKNVLHRLKEKYRVGGKKADNPIFEGSINYINMLPEYDENDLRNAVQQIIDEAQEYGLEIAEPGMFK